MKDILYKEILEEVNNIEIIDTHEHIMSLEEVNQESQHLFRLFENSYANLDFISAGMPPDTWNKKNLYQILTVFKKYYPKVALTTFVRNISRSLYDLYGIESDKISEDNYKESSIKIRDSYKRSDWYEYVLRDKTKIKISLLDSFWNVENICFDKNLFIPVLRTNAFILGRKYISPFPQGKLEHSTIERISKSWGADLDCFESYIDIIDTAITKYKRLGCPAIKIGTAYQRSLHFEKISTKDARSIYKKNPGKLDFINQKKLQDFMAHYLIQKAGKEGMVIQIHTGTFARNGSIISNGNPEQLNNLFLEYPDTKFVLFHFSYPYTSQLFSLGKMFPNVFLDFCWVPMLSDNVARRYLNEFLDLIPYNKLMWGGDSYRVEEAYGGACLARELIALVLSEKVHKKEIDKKRSIEIAQAVLYNNAAELYNLTNF